MITRRFHRLAIVAVMATVTGGLLGGTQAVAHISGDDATSASVSVVSAPSNSTTVVVADNVSEMRKAVNDVLVANDASHAWPRVDADLTPKLESAPQSLRDSDGLPRMRT